jgi:hypothetical protein
VLDRVVDEVLKDLHDALPVHMDGFVEHILPMFRALVVRNVAHEAFQRSGACSRPRNTELR